jgi:hypothetical protein
MNSESDGHKSQHDALLRHLGFIPGGPGHIQVDFEGRAQRPPDTPPPNELPIGDEADTAANYLRLVRAGRAPVSVHQLGRAPPGQPPG